MKAVCVHQRIGVDLFPVSSLSGAFHEERQGELLFLVCLVVRLSCALAVGLVDGLIWAASHQQSTRLQDSPPLFKSLDQFLPPKIFQEVGTVAEVHHSITDEWEASAVTLEDLRVSSYVRIFAM